MSYLKNHTYREMPFYPSTQCNDFYTYIDLKAITEKCEDLLETTMKCRTFGILQSIHGRFYLTDLNAFGSNSEPLAQVSMVYMQSPPQTTVKPYPVQIFGTLQWKNRPVIFAKILQVLNVPTAIRLKSALSGIISSHLAITRPCDHAQIEDAT